MSDEPLKRLSAPTAEEARAAALTRAAGERGDVPPHDAIGERAWKGMQARLDAPPPAPKAWLKPALALSTVLAIAGVSYARSQQVEERPHVVLGTAFLLDGGKAVHVGDAPLSWTSAVVAGENAVGLASGDTRVVIGQKSVLVFVSNTRQDLRAGSAYYEVERGFQLHMGAWDVRVTGTRFWVLGSPRENVIEVYEGSVELRSGARTIELHAGDTFKERVAPIEVVAPASAPVIAPPPAPKVEVVKEPSMAEALQLVRAGKYAAAEAMYRLIALRAPGDAEVALYALCKMKIQKQKDHAAGLAILDTLDAAYPTGHLRQERMLTRIEVLFRTAACTAAKRAVAQYVAEYTHATESLRGIDASQCAEP